MSSSELQYHDHVLAGERKRVAGFERSAERLMQWAPMYRADPYLSDELAATYARMAWAGAFENFSLAVAHRGYIDRYEKNLRPLREMVASASFQEGQDGNE